MTEEQVSEARKNRIYELQDALSGCQEEVAQLKEAVRPVLAAYRSESAHITEEQITRAWEVFDGTGASNHA